MSNTPVVAVYVTISWLPSNESVIDSTSTIVPAFKELFCNPITSPGAQLPPEVNSTTILFFLFVFYL